MTEMQKIEQNKHSKGCLKKSKLQRPKNERLHTAGKSFKTLRDKKEIELQKDRNLSKQTVRNY